MRKAQEFLQEHGIWPSGDEFSFDYPSLVELLSEFELTLTKQTPYTIGPGSIRNLKFRNPKK